VIVTCSGTHDPERRFDHVGPGSVRLVGDRVGYALGVQRDDVDPVPAAADPVAREVERELALDVGRDDGARLELRLAEPAQRRPARGQPRLLVVAAHESLVRPGRLEGPLELGLAHDGPAGVAVVEELDGLVQGRAVDERVVWRERHPQHVAVLVLERAGQVVVDLGVAERQRLGDRTVRHRHLGLRRCVEGREPVGGRRDPGAAPCGPTAGRSAAGRSSASSTNGETRRARAPP
jgi:hypothetical protein